MVRWERILSVKLSGYRALTINPETDLHEFS